LKIFFKLNHLLFSNCFFHYYSSVIKYLLLVGTHVEHHVILYKLLYRVNYVFYLEVHYIQTFQQWFVFFAVSQKQKHAWHQRVSTCSDKWKKLIGIFLIHKFFFTSLGTKPNRSTPMTRILGKIYMFVF